MFTLYIVTGIALLISYLFDIKKTNRAIIIGSKKLLKMLPSYIKIVIIISIILLISEKHIITILNEKNIYLGVLIASAIGSISMMPGFITFPLAGVLLSKGVSYTVISAFTSTMMIVGIATFPLEKSYFGNYMSILRNIMGLIVSISIAVITGIVYGELF